MKARLPWVLWPCWWLSEVWAPGGLGGSSPQRLRLSCNRKHTHEKLELYCVIARLWWRHSLFSRPVPPQHYVSIFTLSHPCTTGVMFLKCGVIRSVAASHSVGRGMCSSFNQEQPEVYTSVTQLHAEEERKAESSLGALMWLWWRAGSKQQWWQRQRKVCITFVYTLSA